MLAHFMCFGHIMESAFSNDTHGTSTVLNTWTVAIEGNKRIIQTFCLDQFLYHEVVLHLRISSCEFAKFQYNNIQQSKSKYKNRTIYRVVCFALGSCTFEIVWRKHIFNKWWKSVGEREKKMLVDGGAKIRANRKEQTVQNKKKIFRK